MIRTTLISGLAVALFLAACGDAADQQSATAPAQKGTAEVAPVIEPWGYPLDAIDNSIRPQDDLYRFANGGWLDATTIPSDRSGVGFSQTMRDRNEERIESIIADIAASEVPLTGNQALISALYTSYMDDEAANAAGMAPIAADLARIQAAESLEDIAELMADPALGARSLFDVGVWIDSKAPDQFTVYADHAGTALPDKSYYERDSERLNKLRKAYVNYMENVFTRIGFPEVARDKAEAVFALEKAIASHHWSRAERRNADRTYNPMTPASLDTFAPGFPWQILFAPMGLGSDAQVIVSENTAFPPMAQLFAETDVAVWRDYLAFHQVARHARYLSDEIAEEHFAFFGTVVRGQQIRRPRDRRGIQYVNSVLDQAVGELYIERFFPQESKRQVTEMFENIRTALGERIDNLTWMSDTTKVRAREKLSKLTAKIAYPDVWTDYSGLTLVSTDLMANVRALRTFDHERDVARLSERVDKREWFTGPQTVNAFYSPSRNEAFIPAGYIQSPLFDPNADAALNYGALGSIIGHEIGHGFDDQGSKYDGDGVLQSWWTPEDRAAFDALGDKLAAQFDAYEPLAGLNVNGRQTLGENIGDLAGMIVAHAAYRKSLGGAAAPVLDGFTGDQRFFLGRAQGRRYKRTEESLRQRLLSAPHSPMYLRVNGMARNMDAFYEAFSPEPGDEMYLAPEDRVHIW